MKTIKEAKQLNINDCYSIEPTSQNQLLDTRGKFIEVYHKKSYSHLFDNNCIKEINFSISRKNVFRGLHCDNKTTKLIQCISGDVEIYLFDILTNEKYTTGISEYNNKQILVAPKIFLGYRCVTEHCKLLYCLSKYYNGPDEQYTMSAENIFDLQYSHLVLSKRDYDAKRFELNDDISKFK